ncbi:recombinase family protein [Lactobacillus johnsonii]|nr:recombinase family protein [Lactobacillus johnsonii]
MAKIGYARVSSKDQNLARQIETLHNYGIKDDMIFKEKVSGATIEARTQLKAMLNFIRKGDIVYVAALDRLGRSAKDIGYIIQQIHAKGATLITPELPDFSQIPNPGLRAMFTEMMLAVFKYQAEEERKRIKARQREGIEIAKANGIYKGRAIKYGPNAKKTSRSVSLGECS